MKIVAIIIGFLISMPAFACDIDFVINLKTLGEAVNVELRKGEPGRSKVIEMKRSGGGVVRFGGICPGGYFLAIGDENYVHVTPVQTFEVGYEYESNIRLQKSHGNVDKKKRSEL